MGGDEGPVSLALGPGGEGRWVGCAESFYGEALDGRDLIACSEFEKRADLTEVRKAIRKPRVYGEEVM